MSRLTELLRQAHKTDAQLGADLESEISALMKRRNFGLVFERHQPEAVELAQRVPRRGDKVRVLPPRGSVKAGDSRLWRIERIERTEGGRVGHLTEIGPGGPETAVVSADDLIVVAEFKDPLFPGLVETGRVERGGDKPFHTVINAENFHALQMLTFTHREKVDVIYIDPPYNTGAKDWKYNNDYVGDDDAYRHSKWLAMMERRLRVARELLNPEDSVLIVTIDEKEYLRLGLLLEQTFPSARIQMVSSVISAKGSARAGEFSRSNEFVYFVMFGKAHPVPNHDDMLTKTCSRCSEEPDSNSVTVELVEVEWGRLKRNGKNGRRERSRSGFYPIFLNEIDGSFHSVGTSLQLEEDWREIEPPLGTVAIWPIQAKGTEQSWGISRDKIPFYVENGFIKFGRIFPHKSSQKAMVYYLTDGYLDQALNGLIENVGTNANPKWVHNETKLKKPFTIWHRDSHDAGWQGTRLVENFIPGRDFDFAKSLYAVEDSIRFFVTNKPNAIILDFFSGSGTTAHAVMRLNRQDGGRRQSISITNNEVSATEERKLRAQGLRPGDSLWENLGICKYLTQPRVAAAITGKTPEGPLVTGTYRFNDIFPMSDGFEENAAFFSLTYEGPLSVRHDRAFERIAPMLWMRAGSHGRVIDDLGNLGWDVSEKYGVLKNLDAATDFASQISASEKVKLAFIVTDDETAFQMVCRELPAEVEKVRLYESYLQNFMINTGRSL